MTHRPLFLLTIYTHFVKITQTTPRIREIIKRFARRYDQCRWEKEKTRWVKKHLKTFAYENPDNGEYRFHIHQLKELRAFLKNEHIDDSLYHTVVVPVPIPQTIDIDMHPTRVFRDYQIPIVDYSVDGWKECLESKELVDPSIRSKFIGLQTGKGKSAIACGTIANLKVRTVVLVKPAYMEKWVNDLKVNLNIDTKDIVSVSGLKEFAKLISLAKSNELTYKVIIMSSRSYQLFYKAYQKEPHGPITKMYGCAPDELYPVLKVGLVVLDEIHQEVHANFMGLLYTHVPRILATTATLNSYDSFMNSVYTMMFPMESRYKELEPDRYIKCYAVSYQFKKPEKIRTTEWGSTFYSHSVFEKCIIRHQPTFENYKKFIHYIVQVGYVDRYLSGDKLAIYATSISMCQYLTYYFSKCYPHLTVKRYCEDDDYVNVIEADIRVTTLGSAGAAIDIPGLRVVLNTVNIDSLQSNLQVLGRLRKLLDRDVRYYYIWASNILKHTEYHQRRKKSIIDKVGFIKDLMYEGGFI